MTGPFGAQNFCEKTLSLFSDSQSKSQTHLAHRCAARKLGSKNFSSTRHTLHIVRKNGEGEKTHEKQQQMLC